MSKYKVMMRCVTPVMSASGEVVHAPGDLLPEGHEAIDDSPLAWAPHIVADVEPEPEPVKVEKPEPAPEPDKPVDF